MIHSHVGTLFVVLVYIYMYDMQFSLCQHLLPCSLDIIHRTHCNACLRMHSRIPFFVSFFRSFSLLKTKHCYTYCSIRRTNRRYTQIWRNVTDFTTARESHFRSMGSTVQKHYYFYFFVGESISFQNSYLTPTIIWMHWRLREDVYLRGQRTDVEERL